MKNEVRSEHLTKFEKIELRTLYNGKETGMTCANGGRRLASIYTSSPHNEDHTEWLEESDELLIIS